MPTAKQLRRRYRAKKLTRAVLKGLLVTGIICIGGSSPSFAKGCIKYFQKYGFSLSDKKKKRSAIDTFSNLRKRGLIVMKKKGRDVYISLTPEGKKRAGKYQVDELVIARQTIWDRIWRVLIFDIPERTRIKRDVLRGKLKEFGFYLLQRSVWVFPYPCRDELRLLQEFFGFSEHNYFLLETRHLGNPSVEARVKEYFKLR